MADNNVFGAAVALAAVVGLGITVWNNRVTQEMSRRKLRLDLFEKRFELWKRFDRAVAQVRFHRSKPAVGSVLDASSEYSKNTNIYQEAVEEMAFLFPHPVVWAAEIFALKADVEVVQFWEIEEAQSELFDTPEIKARRDAYIEAKAATNRQYRVLIDALSSTLDFSDVTKDGEAPPLGSSVVRAWRKAKTNRLALEREDAEARRDLEKEV